MSVAATRTTATVNDTELICPSDDYRPLDMRERKRSPTVSQPTPIPNAFRFRPQAMFPLLILTISVLMMNSGAFLPSTHSTKLRKRYGRFR